MPKGFFENRTRVIWVLWDRYFDPEYQPKSPFAPVVEIGSRPEGQAGRVQARRVVHTKIPDDILTKPYPNALISFVYESDEAGRFVGTHSLMKNRHIRGADMMRREEVLLLDLMPWADKVRGNPALQKEYLLDDTEDYSSPRYWVESYLSLRSASP